MPDYGDVDPVTGRTSARTEFEGTLDQNAPSVLNGQITPAQWAQYQSRRRRDAILGVLGVLGGASALGFAGQAISGAGAGAASAAGAGSGAEAGAGALPPIAGGAPWAVTPYATTAAMAGTGAAAGAGAGAGSGILGGLGARELAALGTSLAGTVGGAMSDRPNLNPNTSTSDPNLQALMQLMQGRLQKSEPLYDSVLAMANGLLPTQYQKGGGGMR